MPLFPLPVRARRALLSVLFLWTISLPAGAGQDRAPRLTGGVRPPEIVQLTAPGWTRIDLPFDVAVTAADSRGIGFVELEFGGETRRVQGNGRRTVSGVVTFAPRARGWSSEMTLRATPFAADGRTAGPSQFARVSLATDDARATPVDDEALGIYRRMFADRDYANRTGLVESVGPVTPVVQHDPRPWWIRWQDKGGPQRFDWESCGVSTLNPALPDAGGAILDCWLALHPNVRSRIVWEEVNPNVGPVDPYGVKEGAITPLAYANWTGPMKLQLGVTFFHAYQYLHYGVTWFNGQYLPPIPPNQLTHADHDGAYTVVSHDDAWQLYLGTIAHSLALEIGGFVPWSIVNYQGADLDVLFHSSSMFTAQHFSWYANDVDVKSVTGYFVPDMIPAPPTMNFEFLLAQDSVRSTQSASLGQYLAWARKTLRHTGSHYDEGILLLKDGSDAISAEAYWGYRGVTPASQVINGTILTPPSGSPSGPYGWVRGCIGVSYFTQQALRAVNIPVQIGHPGGVHTTALFWTLGRALSHGDDVYGYAQPKTTPVYPASAILMPMATYDHWFFGAGQLGPGGIANVGRQRDIELPLTRLGDELLQRYCADKAANATHANGTVAEYFHDASYNVTYYGVAELEALNLWQKLGTKAAALGYCTP